MLAFELSLQLLLFILIGFFILRRGLVDKSFDKSLASFIMNIALPCLIIKSFDMPFSAELLESCGILLVISFGLLGLCFILGHIAMKLSGEGYAGRILRFGMMFPNITFVGMPVMEALYGQLGLFYFSIFIIPVRIFYYSSAKPLLSSPEAGGEKAKFKGHLKSILSPPFIAVFIGLSLYISGLSLPDFLDKTISDLGSVCSPLGMILCGITLGKYKLSVLLKLRYLDLPLIRNLLIPSITAAIMYFIPADPLVSKVVVVYSALPVASMLTAFTIEYCPESKARLQSAGYMLISVLMGVFTVPVWAYICELLF
jgi:predicted permease